ncbi:hypothetical protein EDB19DRAFT_1916991 [Suillus lakei]|nr:hypothetical protein EDB19DRAFT_1916991 [Suillus lakei]
MLSSPKSSSPSYSFQHSLDGGSEGSAPPIPNHLLKIMLAGHSLEKQIYIIRMSLDGIDMLNDEQDRLFTMYSIDMVHSSYTAAKNRVHQYIQFVVLLKHDEDAWAQRLQEAGYIVMEQSLYRVSLEEIEVEDDQQDALLKCTIDTILSNYIAAQH